MDKKDCRHFETCSAPICPKTKGYEQAIWYSGEEVCHLIKSSWMKKQLKIQRKGYPGFFTLNMLNNKFVMSKKTRGLVENVNEEEKWLKDHPARKQLSEEQKKAFVERTRRVK